MKTRNLLIALAAVTMFSMPAFGQDRLTCPTALAVGTGTHAGDTLLAGTAGTGSVQGCLDEYGGNTSIAVGVNWYAVTGTGNTITASLCTNELVNIDATMIVSCFSCADKACVGASEDSCGSYGYNPEVSWCSGVGETYWIAVGDNYTPQGTFNLDITDDGTACGAPVFCDVTCGDDFANGNEECDGTDHSCEVECDTDCTCVPDFCGNDIKGASEECDGTDKDACEGPCVDCECETVCGNNIWELGEMCDGTDDDLCEGLCIAPGEVNECQCPPGIPAVSTWGLVMMTLLGLTAGTIYYGRRRLLENA